MKTERTRELINTIAPTLRASLAEGEALKIVRFEEGLEEGEGVVLYDLPNEASPILIAAALRKILLASTGKIRAVAVPNVGTFHVFDPISAPGRVAGKVALVTGAARGFGLEIAQELADEGACVILADVNDDGARAEAEKINHGFASESFSKALGLRIDVSNRSSVIDAVHQTVLAYGGLDLLVSNAGVVRPEGVKTQSEEDFDFMTDVNYKGYFLCVQAVASILATQRAAKSDYFSDIVQINSKSGLVGSNRNFAYAGSKFGGIGLTQSIALELIEDGVKVNSICPGNFFDGPLWSDPENGLFSQYLNAGKVPGAKTIEDVKHFYEAKVPMGRGCTTPDVMKAIYYLMEQKYETGQAVPVTGGQVMLS